MSHHNSAATPPTFLVWFCDVNCTDNGPCPPNTVCSSKQKNPGCFLGNACNRIPICVDSTSGTFYPVTSSANTGSPSDKTSNARTMATLAPWTTGEATVFEIILSIHHGSYCICSSDSSIVPHQSELDLLIGKCTPSVTYTCS